MRLTRYHHPAVLAFVTGLVLSCNSNDLVAPSTGVLEVTTATVGIDKDTDGYTIQLDDRQAQAIGTTGTLQTRDLPSGNHVVELGGLAANCSVAGENPRAVSITAEATASISFEVSCTATTGTLEIAVATSGESLDPDGFTVSVDNRQFFPSSVTGSITVPLLPAGNHTVALDGVAPNCTVSEGLSQTVSLSPATLASIRFTVACTFAGATRWTSIPLPPGVTAEIGWGTSRSLWGTSPTDLFVVGSVTQPSPRWGIWHYDGQAWTEQVSGDTVLVGIWGISSSEVFAIGRPGLHDPNRPGAILRYDGSRWSDMPGPVYNPPISSVSYAGIWGATGRDLFVAGTVYRSTPVTQLLAHYDGTAWSEAPTPVFGDYPGFTDLAGTSSSDVWAIGRRQLCDDCNHEIAMVAHYDGDQWKEALSVSGDIFHGVWATAPNDVWVVGRNAEWSANVLHFDGTSWSRGEPLATYENALQDVWGSSASDVYAVGPGILIHYDGSGWSRIANIGGDRVWGTSRQDVFVLRGTEILHGTP